MAKTRRQAARRVKRPVKVTKHGTIRYVRHGFLLVFHSNFVAETHRFLRYLTSNMPWSWKPG